MNDDDLDLDFNFPEIEDMPKYPWYKTIKEIKENEENE